MERYRYTRDGEIFTVGPDGLTLIDANGKIVIDRVTPLPADVVVTTVLDLTLAGWKAA